MSRMPLSSYDPRYRHLLLQGVRGRVELPEIEYGRCVKLRQLMQEYRNEAKKANMEGWEALYQAVLRIEKIPKSPGGILTPKAMGKIIIEPRAKEFDDALPPLSQVLEGAQAVGEGGGTSDLKGLLDELAPAPQNEGENKP